MQNDRPLTNPHMAECRQAMSDLLAYYDLAGAFCLIDGQEWGYAYHLPATWNAVVRDSSVQPLGFRILAKSADIGHGRAHELLTGTAHMLCSLKDFARQTQVWMNDLLGMLRRAGIEIEHTPFGGERLPRLTDRKS